MIEIRQARWDDIIYIAMIKVENLISSETNDTNKQIIKDLFVSEFYKRWLRRFPEKINALVLSLDQQFSGFISYFHHPEENASPPQVCEVDRIYIIPSQRRQGYGHKIWQAFLQEAKNKKYKKIIAHLDYENQQVKEFYNKLGFQTVKEQIIDSVMGLKSVEYQLELDPAGI